MNLLAQREDGTWPEIAIPRSRISVAKQIIAETAAKHRISVAGLLSDWRIRSISSARREAIWRIAGETDLSLAAIGRMLNRDHTTIIYTVRRHNDIVGANVRNLGGVRPEFVERQKRFAEAYRARTRAERQRRSEVRTAHKARALFEAGKDTAAIAHTLRRPEAMIHRLLHDVLALATPVDEGGE